MGNRLPARFNKPTPSSYDDFLFEFNGLVQQNKNEEAIRLILSNYDVAAEFIKRQQKRINIMVTALQFIRLNSNDNIAVATAIQALTKQAEEETSK